MSYLSSPRGRPINCLIDGKIVTLYRDDRTRVPTYYCDIHDVDVWLKLIQSTKPISVGTATAVVEHVRANHLGDMAEVELRFT